MSLAYCDYIAHTVIRPAMMKDVLEEGGVLEEVGRVVLDLEPKEGYMISTAKRIEVSDFNGKKYRVTIEEID